MTEGGRNGMLPALSCEFLPPRPPSGMLRGLSFSPQRAGSESHPLRRMVSEPERGAPFDDASDFSGVTSRDLAALDCLEQIVASGAPEPVLQILDARSAAADSHCREDVQVESKRGRR